jgi:ankyrin repeat protein
MINEESTSQKDANQLNFFNKLIKFRGIVEYQELNKKYLKDKSNPELLNYSDSSTRITAFHLICATGYDWLIEAGLKAGGNPNTQSEHDPLRETPVHRFLRINTSPFTQGATKDLHILKPKVIFTFIKAGANPNLQDAQGKTALHIAIELDKGTGQYLDLIRALMAAGADAHLADNQGITAYRQSKEQNSKEVTKALELHVDFPYSLTDKVTIPFSFVSQYLSGRDLQNLREVSKSFAQQITPQQQQVAAQEVIARVHEIRLRRPYRGAMKFPSPPSTGLNT